MKLGLLYMWRLTHLAVSFWEQVEFWKISISYPVSSVVILEVSDIQAPYFSRCTIPCVVGGIDMLYKLG